ncbi:hypothetical protein CY34DRAFT_623468 [Suillus luteus UH-Slu-Lm8-n1]|uniref:Uncharacterized protein n=1 Tax=Suillus luteus UH-Slu-Lm8-n1 TaxID=930992 RepID=A0A0D0A372_9AGAM|nr:hypothetical protein CY34DRAFT_623468 [Suillus luteus UH-Slu-Lm8-n1]
MSTYVRGSSQGPGEIDAALSQILRVKIAAPSSQFTGASPIRAACFRRHHRQLLFTCK